MILRPAPEILEDEDLLEMLNAGLANLLVVDNHKAQFWEQVFQGITLHPESAVHTGRFHPNPFPDDFRRGRPDIGTGALAWKQVPSPDFPSK